MKLNLKRLAITAAIVVCLMAMAGISKTGRATFKKALSVFAPPPPDVAQRARAKHGWGTNSIQNSLTLGTLTYYDPTGLEVRRFRMALYRQYPDRIRMELERDGAKIVSGFDGTEAWRAGAKSMSASEAREIRAQMVSWPERLFVIQDAGASITDAGHHSEDHRPPMPWQREPLEFTEPVLLDVVAVEDSVGRASADGGDRRRISYWVKSEDSTIYAMRWLELDDPLATAEDKEAGKSDIRVDFTQWGQVEGVLLPFDVIHWRGGRVDSRIQVSDVKLNQDMSAALFQKP